MRPPSCQSCGMPMRDEDEFGTNSDGSLSEYFCKFCWQHGSFVDEGISMHEKIEKNVEVATKMGLPEGIAREMAKEIIPNLKRWKK